MPMLAHFENLPQTNERRSFARRRLRLGLGAGENSVTIHDLSLTGALLETSVPMLVGAIFEVELPEAGRVEGSIVWNSGEYYGCQFELPISPSALSAALLQSDPDREPPTSNPDPLAELQELNAEVERLAWKMENAISRLTKGDD
jgi:hypothetical protein